MSRLTAALGQARTTVVELAGGHQVRIRELPLAVTWPYLNGEPIDPDVLIRESVIDDAGEPTIGADEAIPFRHGVELLGQILKFNQLESEEQTAGEVAELERDFPKAASGA
jgi:hypothetical protein